MSFTPLINAASPIPTHGFLALFALVAGAIQLAAPKGTIPHKWLGYSWVGAMAIVALTSFFIHGYRWVGPFGPIHLLSVLTLGILFTAIRDIRRGNVAGHRSGMRQLYFFALIVAGAFTLLPGRIMHSVVMG